MKKNPLQLTQWYTNKFKVLWFLFFWRIITKKKKTTFNSFVVTQFLTHLFDKKNLKIQKWQKITKNPKKKYVSNIFALFFAFSMLSKKEFKFSKVFRMRSTFHASFLKSLIFLIWIDVDIARFKKYKKKKQEKSKFTKKKKKVEGPILRPGQYFTYK